MHTKFKLENIKARHLENPGLDGKTCISNNRTLRFGLDVSCIGRGKVVVSCEYSC